MTKQNDKYENTILYICEQLGGQLEGKKKLAKLLYYIDFDRYEYNESMKTITGDVFKKWSMGPVPEHYMDVVRKLIAEDKLEQSQRELSQGYHPVEIFKCKIKPDTKVFDDSDILIINRVLKKYGGLTGKELEILTHMEAPFVGTPDDQIIPFELSLYRGTDFGDTLSAS